MLLLGAQTWGLRNTSASTYCSTVLVRRSCYIQPRSGALLNNIILNMSSMLTTIGLGPASNLHASGFLMWNWLYAYGVLSSRTMKQYYGVDHNKAPRQDSGEYCEQAVKEGRLSRQTLDRIKRTEAASANSVEGYTFFVAAGRSMPLVYVRH